MKKITINIIGKNNEKEFRHFCPTKNSFKNFQLILKSGFNNEIGK